MATIYQGAFVTIAASKSGDASGGCFALAGVNEKTKEIRGFDAKTQQEYCIYARPVITHLSPRVQDWWIGSLLLLSRGWVYQERLLSPRIVHFGPRELSWECNARATCECTGLETKYNPYGYLPGGKPFQHKLGTDNHSSCRRWYRMVGMVQKMQVHRKGRYLAGLWEDSLIFDMCWSKTKPTLGRSSLWQAPTWSWASLDPGKVHVASDWIRKPQVRADAIITRIDCQPQNPDATSILSCGTLTVRGIIAGFPSCYGKPGDFDEFHIRLPDQSPLTFHADYDYLTASKDDRVKVGEVIYFLRVVTSVDPKETHRQVEQQYIVLRLVSSKEPLFERIGLLNSGGWCARPFEEKLHFEKHAKEMEIMIR